MENFEIVIKESNKETFKIQKNIIIQITKFVGIIAGIVGLIGFVVNCFFKDKVLIDGIKDGAIFFLFSLLSVVAIFLMLTILILLLDLFMLPALLNPKEYKFSVVNNRLQVFKSGKTIVDSPVDEVSFQFVNTSVNGLGGNELGNGLNVFYKQNNRKRVRSINLSRFPDDEKKTITSICQIHPVAIVSYLYLFDARL